MAYMGMIFPHSLWPRGWKPSSGADWRGIYLDVYVEKVPNANFYEKGDPLSNHMF